MLWICDLILCSKLQSYTSTKKRDQTNLLPIGYLNVSTTEKKIFGRHAWQKPYLFAQFKEPYKEKISLRMEDIELQI